MYIFYIYCNMFQLIFMVVINYSLRLHTRESMSGIALSLTCSGYHCFIADGYYSCVADRLFFCRIVVCTVCKS
jgi:hypothetical protein